MENEAIQALSLADNETIQAIALMLGAAWAAGINLYAAVLVLGILGNAGYADLPPALQVLQDPLVIGVAGIMYFIEFFADKTPGVDSGWDAIHTFIRIPAGAVMAAGAAQGLARSYRVSAGDRILIAGNGPLNLQLACELVEGGVNVVAVAESAPGPEPDRLRAGLGMLGSAPGLALRGLAYLATLRRRGVPPTGLPQRATLDRG